MKGFCFILCFLTIGTFSLSQQISFSEFGYDDIVLYGPTPVATLFLKVGKNVNPHKSYVVIKIEPSQVLNFNNSFISIYIWDKPIFSVRLSKAQDEILIPFEKIELGSYEFLKIELRASLTISDDRCKDIETGGLWVKVFKNSYVYVERFLVKSREVKIYNYFKLPLENLLLTIPPSLSNAELEGVVWLYSFLKTNFGIKNIAFGTSFSNIPDTIRNLVSVSLFDKILQEYKTDIKGKFLKSDGLIYIYSGIINGIKRDVLFITGFSDEGLRKAINAFLNSDLVNASFDRFLLVRNAPSPERKEPLLKPIRISFKELGFSTGEVKGIGSLRNSFFFNLSRFGFSPASINVSISAGHLPVSESMGRAFMNVYFNNILVGSKRLGEEGKINYKFSVDRFSLMKLNNLSIEFIYYPNTADCENRIANFFYKIDDVNSYIEVEDFFRPEVLDFTYFPGMFFERETVCLIDVNVTLPKLEALAKTVYLINSKAGDFKVYPRVIPASQVEDEILSKYNIIAILDPELVDKFEEAVIRFKNRFRIISEPTGRTLYVLWDTSSVGVAQVFYGRNKSAILLITGLGTYRDFLILKFVSLLEDKSTTLRGNLGIVDASGVGYFFKVAPSALKVKYPGEKTFLDYFQEYKLFVIIALWFLFLSLLVYVFFRGRKHASRVIKK